MGIQEIYYLIGILAGIFTVVVVPLIRSINMRFLKIEEEVIKKMSKEETKELVHDRFQQTQDDLRELKEKIDRIFDKLLK
jgi:hypothetical protein